MSATYDLETTIGVVRLLIPDTSTSKPIFTDAELQLLLKENDERPKLAAARAIEIIATDPKRLVAYSRGNVSATRVDSKLLLERASALRAEEVGGIVEGRVERDDFW